MVPSMMAIADVLRNVPVVPTVGRLQILIQSIHSDSHAAALTIRTFLGELASNCLPDSGNRVRDFSNHDGNRRPGL